MQSLEKGCNWWLWGMKVYQFCKKLGRYLGIVKVEVCEGGEAYLSCAHTWSTRWQGCLSCSKQNVVEVLVCFTSSIRFSIFERVWSCLTCKRISTNEQSATNLHNWTIGWTLHELASNLIPTWNCTSSSIIAIQWQDSSYEENLEFEWKEGWTKKVHPPPQQ